MAWRWVREQIAAGIDPERSPSLKFNEYLVAKTGRSKHFKKQPGHRTQVHNKPAASLQEQTINTNGIPDAEQYTPFWHRQSPDPNGNEDVARSVSQELKSAPDAGQGNNEFPQSPPSNENA